MALHSILNGEERVITPDGKVYRVHPDYCTTSDEPEFSYLFYTTESGHRYSIPEEDYEMATLIYEGSHDGEFDECDNDRIEREATIKYYESGSTGWIYTPIK